MLDQAQRLRQLAVENAAGNVHKSCSGPKIITVTSGKGGVGKSNFVVNTAITLSKMGHKVMIFDADMGMGNDDILMGFLPKYNVYDIIYNNKSISDVIIDGPFGVKLLPGGTGLNKIEELTEDQREGFINSLTSLNNLDYILMDTGAGINRSVLGFIACCEELIIITTPEPTSLTDAYSLLKAVTHFKLKNTAKVVVNRVLDNDEGLRTFDKFHNACWNFLKLNLEYLGSISDDRKLVLAVREQKPFVISHPYSDAAKDIKIIADKLIGIEKNENSFGVQGLFKKLFSIFS